jgi:ubiquinone/menaquinone biosynthesis C-methylase UbiE
MTLNWLPPLALTLMCICVAPNAGNQESVKTVDPESSEKGRADYMGRPVARTMHWSGAQWLLRASREDEEQSSQLLSALKLEAGQTVCDFGSGNGYYSLPIAALVGSTGSVWAVDIQSEMLRLLEQRAAQAEIENIRTLECTLTDPMLPAGTCDGILLVDVYHEISHPVSVLGGLRKALKPGGRLFLGEFRLEDPDVPIKLEHKMSKAQLILEMKANGFGLAEEFDELPWQHLMVFEVDSEFPREAGQTLAEGHAVAKGLRRAWLKAEQRSLAGYFAPTVHVARNSELNIKAGRDPDEQGTSPVMSTKAQYLGLAKAYFSRQDSKTWRNSTTPGPYRVSKAEESTWSGVEEGDLQLQMSTPAGVRLWILRRNQHGQWLVVYGG